MQNPVHLLHSMIRYDFCWQIFAGVASFAVSLLAHTYLEGSLDSPTHAIGRGPQNSYLAFP